MAPRSPAASLLTCSPRRSSAGSSVSASSESVGWAASQRRAAAVGSGGGSSVTAGGRREALRPEPGRRRLRWSSSWAHELLRPHWWHTNEPATGQHSRQWKTCHRSAQQTMMKPAQVSTADNEETCTGQHSRQ